ncbi:MAG: methenyltetrahydromethanopterin cyclohydrolase [Candidatus Bathyarchaeota archaeon]
MRRKLCEAVTMALSVNTAAQKIVQSLINEKDQLSVKVTQTEEGTTIIDVGLEARGGYVAGQLVTEVCMGGLGTASLGTWNVHDFCLPGITVMTDCPAIALLGSQFAGWRVKVGQYFAMGSGPARALALKPRDLYAKIGYRDEADIATIFLEASALPPKDTLDHLLTECQVRPDRLSVIVASTSSIAGSTQISGRILETGLHKLTECGLDPQTVLSGVGYAPIAPIHPKVNIAMGRTNDMILYGGEVFFTVASEDDDALQKIVEQTPSSQSRDYGRPFATIFKDAGYDFYKIDPALFAPALVTVNNVITGKSFTAGAINVSVLKQSIGL